MIQSTVVTWQLVIQSTDVTWQLMIQLTVADVTTEGLFRKCGSSSRQQELRTLLLASVSATVDGNTATCSTSSVRPSVLNAPTLLSSSASCLSGSVTALLSTFSPHDVASLLKGLLAELPQPLLQDHNFALHCNLAGS